MNLVRSLIAVCLVGAACLWAQTTSPPSQPPMQHDHMMAMHHQMMQMQDQVKKMRATLEKMRANLDKITDPVLKQQAQDNVDLWEQMVEHMEGMSKMMWGHPGMGMMDHMHGMQGMQKNQPTTTPTNP